MAETRPCQHCGTPFPAEEDDRFCCAGCAHVHRLIHREGLDRFYSLRDRSIEPVSSASGRPADLRWLETAAAEAEAGARESNRPARLVLDLKGISCIGCVWLIEELFRRQPGGRRLAVSPQTGRAEIEWNPGVFSPVAFAGEIRRFGYRLAPLAEGDGGGGTEPLLARLGICAFLALNTMLFTLPGYLGMEDDFPFADLFELLALLFATISYGVAGLWFVGRAWDAARLGVLHIDLPIAIGVTAAWGGSVVGWLLGHEPLVYFDFVAVFLFLMLAGRWLQERSIERNRARARSLGPTADRYDRPDGAEPVGVAEMRPGIRYEVPPGGLVPVLSVLESEPISGSLESINGEADPVPFATGARIPSGAVLTSGTAAVVVAAESWDESVLRRLLADEDGPSRNPILERVLAVYTGVVIGVAAIGGAAWAIFGGPLAGLQTAISVLVVSCPCSLGVAWPLINDLAAARLRRHGVYLRNIELWGRLQAVRDLVFDKTGTLTLEHPRLRNPAEVARLAPGEKAALLGLVEPSFHPVGRALRDELLRAPDAPAPTRFSGYEECPGAGVSGTLEGERWTLGKAGWSDAGDPGTDGTVLARNGTVVARFRFADAVRSGARNELAALRQRGLGVAILSGDRQEKVDALAGALGLPRERCLGELDPERKAKWIERFAPGRAMMIGDGANDALAFSKAICRGTPLLDKGILESRCDFFFTGRDLSGIRRLFDAAGTRARKLRAVFAFAVAYNTVAIAVCLAGWMNPLLAAVLMPASALVTLALASGRERSREGTGGGQPA